MNSSSNDLRSSVNDVAINTACECSGLLGSTGRKICKRYPTITTGIFSQTLSLSVLTLTVIAFVISFFFCCYHFIDWNLGQYKCYCHRCSLCPFLFVSSCVLFVIFSFIVTDTQAEPGFDAATIVDFNTRRGEVAFPKYAIVNGAPVAVNVTGN